MRERIRDLERLHHIDECIDNVMAFLKDKTFEEMEADKMCLHAVVYNIMIIGEAANMLTKEFREEHPEVPWRSITDMRNVLVHGYYTASPCSSGRLTQRTFFLSKNKFPSILQRYNRLYNTFCQTKTHCQ